MTSEYNALCTIGFQGLRHDEVTGNIYQRAREYSPRLGRFLQRDPLGYPDGMNTYAAYHVMYGGVDPSGMVWGWVEDNVIDPIKRKATGVAVGTAITAAKEVDRHRRNDTVGIICTGASEYAEDTGKNLRNLKDGVDESLKQGLVGAGNLAGVVSDEEFEAESPVAQRAMREVERGATPSGALAIIGDQAVNGVIDGTVADAKTTAQGIANGDPDQVSNGLWGLGTMLLSMARNGGLSKALNEATDCPNNRPPNMSPDGAGRTGAFREAKRQNGIPTSQQPDRVTPNADKQGNPQPGRQYHYKQEDGTEITIRDDSGGHVYPDDPSQNRGPHFNDPDGNHYDY